MLLALLSYFRLEDLKALKVTPLASPIIPMFVLACILILASFVGALASSYSEGLSDLFDQARIATKEGAASVRIGAATISVEPGRLEASIRNPNGTLVVLPANEFFDDACITDPRSALGAFVQAKFPGRAPALQRLVADQLSDRPSKRVEREPGVELQSYGVGSTVFLDRPLGTDFRLLLAAATTHRPGVGLRAEPGTVFAIVKSAYATARDHRIGEICLPLVGAGHGAMNRELALATLLLAWSEALFRHPSNTTVRVVVFQADAVKPPEVSIKRSKRLLRFALATCRPAT